MQNPSLSSYIKGILAGIVISFIFIGLPILTSIKASCEIIKAECPVSYLLGAVFSSIGFTISALIIVIISIILIDYLSRINHAKRT